MFSTKKDLLLKIKLYYILNIYGTYALYRVCIRSKYVYVLQNLVVHILHHL